MPTQANSNNRNFVLTAQQELLTVRQAAQLMSLSQDTIYSWAASRKLPTVRLGRALRFRRDDIEKLISNRSQPARKNL